MKTKSYRSCKVLMTVMFEMLFLISVDAQNPSQEADRNSSVGQSLLRTNGFTVVPEIIDENLHTGEKKVSYLNIANESAENYSWQIETLYQFPLQTLGWNLGSTPLGEDDGILGMAPDFAVFIKDVELGESFNEATLRLGYDDGVRVWINGQLVLDDKLADHPLGYWNQVLDVRQYLAQGVNRFTAIVFNGYFAGSGMGEFDCELEVDGAFLIKRGNENYGEPEAEWFYYGETAQTLEPPEDVFGRKWWETDYGRYHWLSLNKASTVTGVNEFESLGWNYWSAPFGYSELLLNQAPDNAFFIKDFEIGEYEEATLYLSYDDGCLVILNGGLIFDFSLEGHGMEYWNKELDISQMLVQGRNRLTIEVFNGVYNGYGEGYFDCQLTVDGQNIIKRGDENWGEPEAMWYAFGELGQVLTPPTDSYGRMWYEMDYALVSSPMVDMGWKYQSTPVFENEELLGEAPDNAQFIKDVEVPECEEAFLRLGFDDGCRVWINGTLEFDFHGEDHGINYWDQEVDVSGILLPGRNRIAIEVYNGIYSGSDWGAFDCELIADGTELIKRGDLNAGEPEAMWFMFGKTHEVLTPPTDQNGLAWYDYNYGLSGTAPASNISGNIMAWEQNQVMVVLDATGLSPGEYTGIITLSSNLRQDEIEIPVTMAVLGEPVLAFSPDAIDFGDCYIEFGGIRELTFINQGTEMLEIFNIYPLDGSITISESNFYIEPGEYATIEVGMKPNMTGLFNSALVINSNDPKKPFSFVKVSANLMNAPDIDIPNVQYLFASIFPGDTEVQDISIYNNGASTSVLNFSIPQASGSNRKSELKPVPGNTAKKPVGDHIRARKNSSLPDPNERLIGKKDCTLKNKSQLRENDVIIFSDDMENGDNGWIVENYLDTQTQWHLVTFNSLSPDHSWWCGNELSGSYYNGSTVFEAIISPKILLPHWGNTIILEFAEFYQVEEGYDQLNVDISPDGGENWIRIREGGVYWTDNWVTASFDISDFAQSEIKVKFLINTGDEIANHFAGWFVDDVRIYSPGFPFLSIDTQSGTVNAGEYANMHVTFNASDYAPGFYVGYFLIFSNDPDEPLYYLPAHMEVRSNAIPEELYLQNITVPSGADRCYNALQTIIIAGQGSDFTVDENAYVQLIAGSNIVIKDHTRFLSGSWVHVFIDLEGVFCNEGNPTVESKNIIPLNGALSEPEPADQNSLRIYPNPASDFVTIEMQASWPGKPARVIVSGINGDLVFDSDVQGGNWKRLDVSCWSPGIYLIRVITDNELTIRKLIKM